MCGVAGIYAYHYAANPVDRGELLRIREHMNARGPDGSGAWLAADTRAGLAHRRLAVIDLSDAAAQPMATADGGLVISYNGEIYNYRELRRELEARGARFRTGSDTEVLLLAYQHYGVGMLARLRGMFAFVIWDAERREMLLARDPLGIKPLYYADDGWTFRCASQVKALVAGRGVSTAPEPAGIVGFFLFGSVPEPYTTLQAVRSVPAGCFMRVTQLGARAPQPYFSVPAIFAAEPSRPAQPDADVAAHVRSELLESVRAHLVADVPVGVFLSAGVDSGSLLGLMRDAGQRDTHAVTLAFKEFVGQPEDEAPLAARTAAHYGVRHTVRTVSEDEFRADLPRILEAMDQPSIDGINAWFISKAAHEAGLKVAITGLGGDELFGGYPTFRDLPRWVSLLRLPSAIPGLGPAFRAALQPLATRIPPYSPKLAGMVRYGGSYAGAYFLKRGLFMPWELAQVLDPALVAAGLERLQFLDLIRSTLQPAPVSTFGRVVSLEVGLYLRNQLLRDCDWAGMAHSLEIRTPFVDAPLLRALGPRLAKRGSMRHKQLLAQSPSVPLPAETRLRAKTGFTTPVGNWIRRAEDRQWGLIPLLGHSRCHWSRRWAYTVLWAHAAAPMPDVKTWALATAA